MNSVRTFSHWNLWTDIASVKFLQCLLRRFAVPEAARREDFSGIARFVIGVRHCKTGSCHYELSTGPIPSSGAKSWMRRHWRRRCFSSLRRKRNECGKRISQDLARSRKMHEATSCCNAGQAGFTRLKLSQGLPNVRR